MSKSIREQLRDNVAALVVVAVIFLLVLFAPLIVILSRDEQSQQQILGDIIGAGGVLMYMALVLGTTGLIVRRQLRRMQAVLEEQEPAFEEEIDIEKLRSDRQLLEPMRGKINRLCLIERTAGTSGDSDGRDLGSYLVSFAVDTEGVIHDIEESRRHDEVRANLDWLASQLDVPIDDATV